MDIVAVGAKMDTRDFVAGGKKVENTLDRMRHKTAQATGKMKKSFKGLVTSMNPIGAALTGIAAGISFTAVIRNASQFEKKMAEVSTLLDDTSSVDGMAKSMDELSRSFGTSAVEQAGALYTTISAGAANAEEAVNTLTVANKLAVGGVTTIEVAVDGLTTVMNAYGDAAGTATDISDSMFVAMRAGKTTIGEISSAVGKVAPLAAKAGLTVDELNASIATLTLSGIKTTESVTGLRAILASLTKVLPEAAEEAERLGLAWGPSAVKDAGGFTNFLNEVIEKTGGASDSLAKLFGGVEALVPALVLTGEGFETLVAVMDDMKRKGGETAKAAEKMEASFDFQWKQFTSEVSSLARALGEALLPAISGMVSAMTDGINTIRDWGAELKLILKLVVIGGALHLGLKAQAGIYALIGTNATLAAAGIKTFSAALFVLSGALATATGALRLFFANLTTLGKVFVSVATIMAGWEIGNYLFDQFLTARLAASHMAETFLVAIERMKQGWRTFKAVISGNAGDIPAILRTASEEIESINKRYDQVRTDLKAEVRGALNQKLELPKKEIPKPDLPDLPDLPDPPDTSAADEAAKLQERANGLLDDYTKRIALGSKATELQTLQYELMNGELKELNPEMKKLLEGTMESVNAAQAQEDILSMQGEAITDITNKMSQMRDQTARLSFDTAEQAASYDLTTEKMKALGSEFDGLKQQYVEAARAMDDARFEKEAQALEEAVLPAKRYAAALENINMLRERGKLSAEAYEEAMYNEFLRFNETARAGRDVMAGFFDEVLTGTVSARDAFVNMVDAWNAKMRSIIADRLADMFMKQFSSLFAKGTTAVNEVDAAKSGVVSSLSSGAADALQDSGSTSAQIEVQVEPTGSPVPVDVIGGMCCGKEAGNYSIGDEIPPSMSDAVESEGTTAAEQVATESKGMFDSLSSGFSNVFDKLKTGATTVWNFVSDGFSTIMSSMGSGLSSVISTLVSLVATAGSGAASGFGSLISAGIGLFTGAPAAAHGAHFKVSDLEGFANNGQFRVGGSGGIDSQLVAFKASPNETVTVSRPQDNLEEFLKQQALKDMMVGDLPEFAGGINKKIGNYSKQKTYVPTEESVIKKGDKAGNVINVNVQVDAKANTKTARQQGYDIGRQIDHAMRRV